MKKFGKIKYWFVFLASLLVIEPRLFAVETNSETQGLKNKENYIVGGPPAKSLWAFGIDSLFYRLQSPEEHQIHGPGARVKAGLNYFFNDSFFLQNEIQIFTGPWGKVRNETFKADFTGYGFACNFVFPLLGEPIRSGQNSLSGIISANYSDLSAKSLGRNLKTSDNPDSRENVLLEREYSLKVQSLFLEAATQWIFFKTPRPSGNTSELLETRLEGHAIRLGVGVPVLSKYHAKAAKVEDTANSTQELKESTTKGRMTGFYMILGGEVWIGS